MLKTTHTLPHSERPVHVRRVPPADWYDGKNTHPASDEYEVIDVATGLELALHAVESEALALADTAALARLADGSWRK